MESPTVIVKKLSPDQAGRDVRMGATSASSLERLYLCRGSWNLESQVKALPKEDAVRESGSRIHGALAGELPATFLDEDEYWMYEECQSFEREIVSIAFPGKDLLELENFTEDRLYMEIDGEIQHSGEFDKLYIDRMTGRMLILDYKTGFLPVTEPERNYQLRSYAVLVWLYYRDQINITSIEVAAIQPRCRPVYARCEYLVEDLPLALKEMLALIRQAKDPTAPRKAGLNQCKYCKALSICDTARETAKRGMIEIAEMLITLDDIDYEMGVDQLDRREQLLSNDSLAELLDLGALIEKWYEALKLEAKLRIKNGRKIPGRELGSGSSRRVIKKVYEIRQKLKEVVSPREFDQMVKLPIGKLESTMQIKTGKKKTEMKQYLQDLLPNMIDSEPGPESLRRVAE